MSNAKNEGLRFTKDNIMSVSDFLNYIFDEDIFFTKEDKSKQDNTNKDKTNDTKDTKDTTESKQEYTPQMGDMVVVTGGDFKGIKGEIIADVDLYNSYQIKVSDINAIYVDKDKIKVIKRKVDSEKKEKIKKLTTEIRDIIKKRNELENELELLEDHLDDLYQELEEMNRE